jgi:hypothetical protein
MKRWNEATWYSRVGAIIFFVGTFSALSFYVHAQYALVQKEIALLPTRHLNGEFPTNFNYPNRAPVPNSSSTTADQTSLRITTGMSKLSPCPSVDCVEGYHAMGYQSGECDVQCVPDDPNQTPIILSVAPPEGPVGTVVTIIGSGFGSDDTLDFDDWNWGFPIDEEPHVSSYDSGTTIRYTIPLVVTVCADYFKGSRGCGASVPAGKYAISITNPTSHALDGVIFTVTAPTR